MPWSRLRGGETTNMQLTFDGVRFDVRDEGAGPAIVLVHGFLLAKESWDAQAERLAERARVVRFDLRGHGKTDAPAGPYLMETLAGDVAGVLDALGIDRAVVAGHSLGGYVAFAFYRMFAERCSGLGLVCTRATSDDADARAARYELADRIERDGIDVAVAAFAGRSFAAQTYRDRPDLVATIEEMNRRTDPRGAAAMLRGMAARVSSDDLFDEIDIPVRIVGAREDAVIPVADAEAMAAGIAGATLDLVPGGHVPLYEDPDAVTASLERLLEARFTPGRAPQGPPPAAVT
jgi:pimeloyl-ACP methyl ester carboxylesterase